MKKYPKIQTMFKRDTEKGPNKNKVIIGEWTLPEFEILQHVEWEASEKIDGTNIRVEWNGEKVRFGGRDENAQIPASLVNHLVDRFTASTFADLTPMLIFGEGYGRKIQKVGSLYFPYNVDFRCFDIFCGDLWLESSNIGDITSKIGTARVPYAGYMTLHEACAHVSKKPSSSIGEAPMEGLVLRAPYGLLTRTGDRLITKIKARDFAEEYVVP